MKLLSKLSIMALLVLLPAVMPIYALDYQSTTVLQDDENSPSIVKKRFNSKLESEKAKLSTNLAKPHYEKYKGVTTIYSGKLVEGIKYDIKKTDSIVSPYTATVFFPMDWSVNGKVVGTIHHIVTTYLYQDGEWVFKDAIRRYGQDKYSTIEEDAQLMRSFFK
jgi:hypothetical protein